MTDEIIEQLPTKPTNWWALAVLVMTAAMAVSLMLFGYLQFSKNNISIANLEMGSSDIVKQVSDLTQTVTALQTTLTDTQHQVAKEAESAAQDKAAADLYMRLSQLNTMVDQLPLPAMQPTAKVTLINPTPTAELSWWRAGWQRTLQALSKIVSVKYIGTDVPPLVTPDAKNYLYQNLHAEIGNAMWATLHHQPEVYQVSLTHITEWVKRYFANDAATTIALLQEVDALQKLK